MRHFLFKLHKLGCEAIYDIHGTYITIFQFDIYFCMYSIISHVNKAFYSPINRVNKNI